MVIAVLNYTADLVIINPEMTMRHNGKIIKMNPGHIVGGYALILIHQKNYPIQDHESKNDFTNDHANSRTALMRAKRN